MKNNAIKIDLIALGKNALSNKPNQEKIANELEIVVNTIKNYEGQITIACHNDASFYYDSQVQQAILKRISNGETEDQIITIEFYSEKTPAKVLENLSPVNLLTKLYSIAGPFSEGTRSKLEKKIKRQLRNLVDFYCKPYELDLRLMLISVPFFYTWRKLGTLYPFTLSLPNIVDMKLHLLKGLIHIAKKISDLFPTLHGEVNDAMCRLITWEDCPESVAVDAVKHLSFNREYHGFLEVMLENVERKEKHIPVSLEDADIFIACLNALENTNWLSVRVAKVFYPTHLPTLHSKNIATIFFWIKTFALENLENRELTTRVIESFYNKIKAPDNDMTISEKLVFVLALPLSQHGSEEIIKSRVRGLWELLEDDSEQQIICLSEVFLSRFPLAENLTIFIDELKLDQPDNLHKIFFNSHNLLLAIFDLNEKNISLFQAAVSIIQSAQRNYPTELSKMLEKEGEILLELALNSDSRIIIDQAISLFSTESDTYRQFCKDYFIREFEHMQCKSSGILTDRPHTLDDILALLTHDEWRKLLINQKSSLFTTKGVINSKLITANKEQASNILLPILLLEIMHYFKDKINQASPKEYKDKVNLFASFIQFQLGQVRAIQSFQSSKLFTLTSVFHNLYSALPANNTIHKNQIASVFASMRSFSLVQKMELDNLKDKSISLSENQTEFLKLLSFIETNISNTSSDANIESTSTNNMEPVMTTAYIIEEPSAPPHHLSILQAPPLSCSRYISSDELETDSDKNLLI